MHTITIINLQHRLLIITDILMRITLANIKVFAQGRCTIDNGVSGNVGLAVVAIPLLQDTINNDLLEVIPHL
jgi:hypothetical protein